MRERESSDGLPTLTARQLNRATLGRQLLLARQPLGVEEAVRRVVALQSQQPASPYLALWNRVTDFDPVALDRALAEHRLVKASLLRITLHTVCADDYRAFHAAMTPTLRASRLGDPRYTSGGLTVADADVLLPDFLRFLAEPRPQSDIQAWLQSRVGDNAKQMWFAMRTFAPMHHVPTGPPWSFGTDRSFVAGLPEPAPGRVEEADAALQTLIRRFLAGFGPAAMVDVAQFAMVQRARAKAALAGMTDDLAESDLIRYRGPDGTIFYDLSETQLPEDALPNEQAPAPPRLLPMWDSPLLAYWDRSRIIPPEFRKIVTRVNGDLLPTLLVDGYVAGVWRPVEGGIEATAFQPLSDDTWRGLEEEARSLRTLLADREPLVYSYYAHWWKKLPPGDTRLLAG